MVSVDESPAYFDVKPNAASAGRAYDRGQASEPQYDSAGGPPAGGGGSSMYFDVRPDPIGKEMFAAYSKGGVRTHTCCTLCHRSVSACTNPY